MPTSGSPRISAHVSPLVLARPVASDPALDARARLETVDAAARALIRPGDGTARLALAVSGGCDSMVLMRAVYRVLTEQGREAAEVRVLTFDHGTGPHSAASAALVASEARRLGFTITTGRAVLPDASEAVWRAARWRFLRDAAQGAVVATAHTLDDQVETVVMRVMRGAGARGLAGLAAPTPGVERPLLGVRRDTVRLFAATHDVAFLDDPSNLSRHHLRNRVRLDLLPAMRRCRPELEAELIALASRAATLRAELDAVAVRFVSADGEDAAFRVAREELATYDSATLCALWPAIAARARVTLDRRGTVRLAQFTTAGAPGARIQLSGGVEVYRHRDSFVVRRVSTPVPAGAVALAGALEFGGWRFRPQNQDTPLVNDASNASDAETSDATPYVRREDPWTCTLPADRALWVRAWQPGDRMRPRERGTARRVKRFLEDARVPGPDRAGWPVVLADDEIVWIPGVRRGVAATERSGRPVVQYACERFRGERSSC